MIYAVRNLLRDRAAAKAAAAASSAAESGWAQTRSVPWNTAVDMYCEVERSKQQRARAGKL
jgi:hypothetical protein